MSSTYSTSLKLELIGNGDQSGTWGTTTNNNLGTLLEQAIVGQTTISMNNADYTLSNYNGTSDEARNAVIIITGNQNASYNVICPASVQKLYVITNSLNAGATAYFKPSGGSALTIPNGYTVLAYSTGSAMVPLAGLIGNQTIIGNLTVSGTSSFTGSSIMSTLTATSISSTTISATTITASLSGAASSSTQITNSGGWSVTPTGTKLYFNYNGTNVASLDSSGNFIALNNVTAYGTP
jgi:hypothetical protein